ncbi:MAG: serine/threonine-protein kinase [Gammaproteobacteria bacterium]
MATSGIPGTTRHEAELPTFSSEEQARTFDNPLASPAAHSPAPPRPGDVLKNRFLLYECLSTGSTSRLFRALDQRRAEKNAADALVTLKIVTALPGDEPAPVQALRREAAIASGLNHPNLLAIHGLDRDGPHTFLCMEWRDGESLGVILDARGTRPMTRVQALRILEGVCQALSYLHARNITHSDIKPGNILVTADGEATLIDFGVASGPGADDLPHTHGYTPEYASPEVLRGADATPVDDLFSVACVAYRMLSGQRAFGTGTAADAEAAGTRPACPEHLSPAQWRALDRALAYDRTDRQPDVETFLNQLKVTRATTVSRIPSYRRQFPDRATPTVVSIRIRTACCAIGQPSLAWGCCWPEQCCCSIDRRHPQWMPKP